MRKSFICSFALLLTVATGLYSKPASVKLPLDRSALKPVTSVAVARKSSKPHSKPMIREATFSTNWSGFVALTNLKNPKNLSVEVVSGAWLVPELTPTPDDSFSSIWVGIDGFISPTVEQIGTEQDWDSVNNVQVNFAWFELFPGPLYAIYLDKAHTILFPVNVGDLMGAEVAYVGKDKFHLTIMNFTVGIFTTIEAKVPGVERNSAQWIVEAPSSATGILPLADFTEVPFVQCTAKIDGDVGAINDDDWQHEKIVMVSSSTGNPKAEPTRLRKDGESFIVGWVSEGP